MNSDSEVFCKDCIHSHVSLFDYITAFGMPNSVLYTCKAHPLEQEINIVTGPIKPIELHSCYSARSCDSLCGKHGKKWTPKDLTKSNLLKVLNRPA